MNPLKVTLPKTSNYNDRKQAQAMVEFALILPIALMLIFVVIEIARMAQAYLVVVNSARVGLRYAVTGAFEPEFCTEEIDYDGDGLLCNLEPDKEARTHEIDAARLLSIYDLTENSAIGIMKDLTITDKDTPGYFHVTVCSTNEGYSYHPPPEGYCEPEDHPGDPSATGGARVLVAVTFEHPVILPIVNTIAPSVTLYAERTGIVEQFRVARVLGLPPVIEVPTATPGPTFTPTATRPVNCELYTFSNFGVTDTNHVVVNVNNNDIDDVTVNRFEMTWQSAYDWAIAFGYNDIELDWFEWNGGNRYNLDDPTTPSSMTASRLLPAGNSILWETDFDWGDEVDRVFIDEFGLVGNNFGFYVELSNGCVIPSPEVYLPPPTPNCDLYSCSDFSMGSYGFVDVDIYNGDEWGTEIAGINYNWDYAEVYGELIGRDQLNVDWIQWGNVYTWGAGNGDGINDDGSTTNTAVDSPETFPGNWSPSYPPFNSYSNYLLRVDFDNEWSAFSTDLLPTDFGVEILFQNGCTLTCAPIERPLPEPCCECYSMEDFTIDQYNRILTTVTNGDIFSTNLEHIVLDWDIAEALSDAIIGPDNLYLDYLYWRWNYVWSNNWDGIGDFSSVTDTTVDSPNAWDPNNTEFDAGRTYNFRADWEYAVGSDPNDAFLNWGLIPSDFGVEFHFENGCVLTQEAVDRPIATPTPDCDNIYAQDARINSDDFQIRVRNNNVASAYLIDSELTWPGPPPPQDPTPGESYVNYITFYDTYYTEDTYYSPVNAVVNPAQELPSATSRTWSADFNNGLPYGYYRGELTFEYPGWGICIVVADLEIVEPTGTPTTNPNATSTPTRTPWPTSTNTPIPSQTQVPSATPTQTSSPIPSATTQPPPATDTPVPSPTSPPGNPTNTPWPTQPGGG